jgi:hypothetical protein
MTRNITVTKKASPQPIAANRILVLSIRILLEYSCEEVRSSEVIRRIIAVAASHTLISAIERGIFITITNYFLLTDQE